MELTLKYQGPETNELLDESSAGEIVRALGESDMQSRIDMHKHKLSELMIVKREGGPGQAGEKTVKDQLRDLMNNKCRRNGKAQHTVQGSKEIQINEYAKPDKLNCKP